MAAWAIITGACTILLGLCGFFAVGWAATGLITGTFGLLFAAASLPKEGDAEKELAPNVKLGIALPVAGVIISILISILM
ncbi:MAG TPA: hypothetical protein PK253_02875 [Spirochaetota bacterium]|nr:hypothetical protein [Spirochaetota bacterium]HPQ52164.1 hypothetical protein [Spirochaetota bacterium]